MILPDQIDNRILFVINRDVKNGFLDSLFIFFSDEGSLFVLVPVLALTLYLVKKKGKEELRTFLIAVILAAAAAGLSDIITSRIIKPFFARPRPCQILEGLYYFKSRTAAWIVTDGITSYKSLFSFVSSHASNSMAAATIMSYFYRKLTAAFVFTSILIGASRAYLGVHYPSDILGGWISGLLTAFSLIFIYRYLNGKYRFLKK